MMIDQAIVDQWHLTPIRALTGRINQHWLVRQGSITCVLRRYAISYTDVEYELNVLRQLRNVGWPVPEVIEAPIHTDGATWSLFSFLPGEPKKDRTAAEQRHRGRLLAQLHEATSRLPDQQQREGFRRIDAVVTDPDLVAAINLYGAINPDVARVMRWHVDLARERFEQLNLADVEQIVIHSDFATWNLLFEGEELSGVLDFESTHLDFRVADFALSWRGQYDDVVEGYQQVHKLSGLDEALLVPVYWSWLFLGVKEDIEGMVAGTIDRHGFKWQINQLTRRSPLFRDLAEPYQR